MSLESFSQLGGRIRSSLRWRLAKPLTFPLRRKLKIQLRQINERQISLVSNNCVAGILYDIAGLQKRSPTAGIYFAGPAYARFLNDLGGGHLERWAKIEPTRLVFKEEQSCWTLPVDGGGELVFLHYASREDAIAKWERRIVRMRGRTLFVISSIQNGIALHSVKAALKHFPYSMTVDGDPAPAADELVMDARFLRDLSKYLDGVLLDRNCLPHSPMMYRYD